MVNVEELQNRINDLCKELGLPTCDVMVHIDMDDYVGIIGGENGGCMIIYEVVHPERYCVSVANTDLKNRDLVYNSLQLQLGKYKEFIGHEEKDD